MGRLRRASTRSVASTSAMCSSAGCSGCSQILALVWRPLGRVLLVRLACRSIGGWVACGVDPYGVCRQRKDGETGDLLAELNAPRPYTHASENFPCQRPLKRYGGDQDVAVLSMMTDLRLAKSVGG